MERDDAGESNWREDVINKLFCLQARVIQHQHVHNQERHQCELCNKTFKWKANLGYHMKLHKNEVCFGVERVLHIFKEW